MWKEILAAVLSVGRREAEGQRKKKVALVRSQNDKAWTKLLVGEQRVKEEGWEKINRKDRQMCSNKLN